MGNPILKNSVKSPDSGKLGLFGAIGKLKNLPVIWSWTKYKISVISLSQISLSLSSCIK